MNDDSARRSASRVLRARSPGLAWTDAVSEGLPPAFGWVELGFDPDAPSFTQHGARPLDAERLDAEPVDAEPVAPHPFEAELVEVAWNDDAPAEPGLSAPTLHPTGPHSQPEARSPKPEATGPHSQPEARSPKPEAPTTLTATNLAASLPPALVEAAAEAHARGEPTFFAAIQLLLALPDWLSELRSTAFRAAGPWPEALMVLLDSAGVDGEIHRGDADRVRRLAARLPIWARRRGHLDVAMDLTRQAGVDPTGWSRPAPAPEASPSETPTPDDRAARHDELFAGHDAAWWRARGDGDLHGEHPKQELRISAGYLQFQPRTGPGWALLPEDVVVTVDPEVPGTPEVRVVPTVERDQLVGRLLPVWAVVRPVLGPRT